MASTFKPNKLLNSLTDAKELCWQCEIPIGEVVSIKVNPRLTSTWGRCKEVYFGEYEIEIAGQLLADNVSYEALMQTVIHELLHTCEGCMNHGALWKQYAARLTRYGYNIKRCTSCEEKGISREPKSYRYKAICEACGSEWYYQRRGGVVRSLQKDPHSCACPCGSHNIRLESLY